MAPIDFWQNYTPFLVWQLSIQLELAILEEDLKNKDEPTDLTQSTPHSAVRPFLVGEPELNI